MESEVHDAVRTTNRVLVVCRPNPHSRRVDLVELLPVIGSVPTVARRVFPTFVVELQLLQLIVTHSRYFPRCV